MVEKEFLPERASKTLIVRHDNLLAPGHGNIALTDIDSSSPYLLERSESILKRMIVTLIVDILNPYLSFDIGASSSHIDSRKVSIAWVRYCRAAANAAV